MAGPQGAGGSDLRSSREGQGLAPAPGRSGDEGAQAGSLAALRRRRQLYSPRIASIELVRRGDVRRAKLYYLRGRRGKAARIAEKGGVGGEAETAASEKE
jgi:hypothetical protein